MSLNHLLNDTLIDIKALSITAPIITGNTKITGNLEVVGTTKLDSTLEVVGASKLDSTLEVVGTTKLDSSLEVVSSTKLDSSLFLQTVAGLAPATNVLVWDSVGKQVFVTSSSSSNTASAIVARDGSGNFAAGTITNSGIIMNNSVPSYVPTTLNYYELLTTSVSWGGAFSSPVVAGLRLIRIGGMVTGIFEEINTTSDNNSQITAISGTIPARFSPFFAPIYSIIRVAAAGTFFSGLIEILTNGSIIVSLDVGEGLFPASVNVKMSRTSVQWSA